MPWCVHLLQGHLLVCLFRRVLALLPRCSSSATFDLSHASVISGSVLPYGLQPTRLLCPWDSPGKSTGVGGCAVLQGIFLTRGSNAPLSQEPALAGRFCTTHTAWEATLSLCVACAERSVLSDSVRPCELEPTRLPSLWGFSRQESWSGWLCPLAGHLPNPGNPGLHTAGAFFTKPLFSSSWTQVLDGSPSTC